MSSIAEIAGRNRFLATVLVVLLLGAAPAFAEGNADPAVEPETEPVVRTTGLKVPRFVSLRSGEVNLRTGPGTRYPVEWVFLRKKMPVEVTAEFDTWRRIRDWEGSEGWVHQTMLSGRRTVIVRGDPRPLRAEPRLDAAQIARAEPGVIAEVKECAGDWCRVDAGGYRGWLRRDQVWGVYPGENFD